VLGRCICPSRGVGRACERTLSWPSYYIGRQVSLLSPSGRFVSSGRGTRRLPALQEHGGAGDELLSVRACGASGNVGLQDASGRWLAIAPAATAANQESGLGSEPAVSILESVRID
jgi:hypothetical protein